MSSQTICFVITSNTLKDCYNVVILFHCFLVISVSENLKWKNFGKKDCLILIIISLFVIKTSITIKIIFKKTSNNRKISIFPWNKKNYINWILQWKLVLVILLEFSMWQKVEKVGSILTFNPLLFKFFYYRILEFITA